MEEGLWYVRREGRVTGPITGFDVRAGIGARRLSPDVELSKDKASWVAASSVPGMVVAPPSTSPASAPPQAAGALRASPAPALRPGSGAPPSPSRFGPPPETTRSRARYRPPQAEPMDGLPEPDAWSARWGISLAVVSLVAWILPISRELAGQDAAGGGGSTWLFPWSREITAMQPLGWQLVQPMAAVGALVIVGMLRGASRGMALLAITVGSVLASLFFQPGRGGLDAFTGPAAGSAQMAGIIALAMLAGGLGAAVGNHLRKRSPEKGPGRALCAAGGALVVLPFLTPVSGTPIIALFFQFGAWSMGWPLVLLLVLTISYGIVGMRHLSSSPAYEGRCRWMSVLGRMLLVGTPVALTIFLAIVMNPGISSEGPSFFSILLIMVKAWGAFVGIFALIGVGLAAWFEDGIYRNQPKPIDPRATADVFR